MPLVSVLPRNFRQLLSYYFNDAFEAEVKFGRFRIDFYAPERKLAFEYDGIQHYSVIQKIDSDKRKEELLRAEGITLKRWPYYFMPTQDVCSLMFGQNFSEEKFKIMLQDMFELGDLNHMLAPGFHKTPNVPANFIWQGIDRFLSEIKSSPLSLQHQVRYSLKLRVSKELDRRLVIPEYHSEFMDFYDADVATQYVGGFFPLTSGLP